MPDVFLSYARGDDPTAKLLSDKLKAKGLTVFSDFELVTGDAYSSQIKQALSSSDAVVVLLSKHSARGKWVEGEVRTALESQQRIIPVLLDRAATENWVWPLISDRHAIRDLPSNSNEAIDKVVEEVVKAVKFTEKPPPPDIGKRASRSAMIIVALLSALAGAIVSWLATR